MVKFKTTILSMIAYILVVTIYLSTISHFSLTIDILYNNIMMFTIVFIMYSSLIMKDDNLIFFKLNKLKTKNKYLNSQVKEYTILNLLITIQLLISNIIIFVIIGENIGVLLMLKYSLNLFLIFEISYLIILNGIVSRNFILYKIIITLFLLFSFYVNDFNYGSSFSINIFKCYFSEFNLSTIIPHYLVWFIVVYLIIDYKIKRINL